MCFGGTPSVPQPVPIPPVPQLPDQGVQNAGNDARARALAAAGPMATILNAGGAGGLTKPASTTAKATLG